MLYPISFYPYQSFPSNVEGTDKCFPTYLFRIESPVSKPEAPTERQLTLDPGNLDDLLVSFPNDCVRASIN